MKYTSSIDLPLPYGRAIYFHYRELPPFDSTLSAEEIKNGILEAFNSEAWTIASFWTKSAVQTIFYERDSGLIERGILSVGHNNATDGANREKPVLNGKYMAGLTWPSVGFDIDPIPAHRPRAENSIESIAITAFAAQLATTIDAFPAVFGIKLKTCGSSVYDALYFPLKGAIELNDVTTEESNTGDAAERDDPRRKRAATRIRRLANEGRRHLTDLSASPAVSLVDPIIPARSGFGMTLDRLRSPGSRRGFFLDEPNPTIRREAALLFALAEVRELARILHRGHLDVRRDEDVLATRGSDPKDIVETVRHPRGAIDAIVEEPARRFALLTELAKFAYPESPYGKQNAFILLSVEIALRYEIDLLILFPPYSIWRSLTQAACAVSACNRRQIVPNNANVSEVFTYWGLRALIEDDQRFDNERKPFRDLVGPIPEALRIFALSEPPGPYGIEHTERFRN